MSNELRTIRLGNGGGKPAADEDDDDLAPPALVRVTALGRGRVEVPPGASVRETLSQAQVPHDSRSMIRIGNEVADLDRVLQAGEELTVVPNVRWGRG